MVLLDAAGLITVFGAPSTTSQQAMWNAMFDSINKSGGAACQKLVPDFQTDDEFNPSSAQNACLAFVQHRDFAVMGGFLPQSPDTCMLQNHIPVFEEIELSSADVQRYYPYYFSGDGSIQVVYRNWAYAARQLNMFNPAQGFKKLGIFYRDCQPEVNAAMLADLQAVGVSGGAVDRADLGCPSAFASPSVIEQAVVKFKSDGVTTATIDNDLQDVQNITKQSQSQGFRPQWTIPDQGTVATTGNPSFSPDPNNFNNALAITPEQYGANNMPGFKESPTDVQCDQIMTSHGQPGALASPDQFAGAVCNLAWMFVAAVNHAPNVAQDQLAAGLQRAGSIPFAFPYGPNSFSAPGTTWGGQFWRPVTYHTSCHCWQTDNPNFQPSF
ncbi:MAG: ABC transporter substrate-binding protein [Actinobacteria bacterium]|nr:MAG: ABC transporter substrate-binding protein [Actinomycetota bacterium]